MSGTALYILHTVHYLRRPSAFITSPDLCYCRAALVLQGLVMNLFLCTPPTCSQLILTGNTEEGEVLPDLNAGHLLTLLIRDIGPSPSW